MNANSRKEWGTPFYKCPTAPHGQHQSSCSSKRDHLYKCRRSSARLPNAVRGQTMCLARTAGRSFDSNSSGCHIHRFYVELPEILIGSLRCGRFGNLRMTAVLFSGRQGASFAMPSNSKTKRYARHYIGLSICSIHQNCCRTQLECRIVIR
ncbi:uncharacterized protein LOC126426960 [Schistocerca serialis cubense]|uniref:uncharacterized protein LOC126426960 n=1 Tax=Schistocerca serialis cubense TaxID=2023355 RepID=UPI00214EBA56|nr:uncharacterized protein LOC126426960 [Schistocerca serialis cubense]